MIKMHILTRILTMIYMMIIMLKVIINHNDYEYSDHLMLVG